MPTPPGIRPSSGLPPPILKKTHAVITTFWRKAKSLRGTPRPGQTPEVKSGHNFTACSVCAEAKESDPEDAATYVKSKVLPVWSIPAWLPGSRCWTMCPFPPKRKSHRRRESRGTSAHLDGVLIELFCPNLSDAQLKAVKLGLISGVRAVCGKKNKASSAKSDVLVLFETSQQSKQTKGYLRNDITVLNSQGFISKNSPNLNHAI